MPTGRRISAALLLVWLLSLLPLSALGQEVPDLSRTGSITVNLAYDGKAVTDGTLSLWRVGEISETDGDYSFVKTDAFAAFTGTLEEPDSAELAERLADFAGKEGISAQAVQANTTGTVTFSDLTPGLYLVVQTTASAGYEALSPFLVSLPLYEDGAYLYDVDANGKFALEKEDTPDEPDEPDKPTGKLPQTGQLNWPVPVLAAGGMALLLIGWACKRKSGNEK